MAISVIYLVMKRKPILWREIKDVEQVRHALIHPKTREEEMSITLSELNDVTLSLTKK